MKKELIDRMIKSFNVLTDKQEEKVTRLENGIQISKSKFEVDDETVILMLVQLFREKTQEIKDNL